MNKIPLYMTIMLTVFILLFSGGMYLWKKAENDREFYKKINKSNQIAKDAKRKAFCDDYKTYASPSNTPYAYQYCFK